MERIFLTLKMDLTNDAPEGAGWYLEASTDGQRLMPSMSITQEAAYNLATDFYRVMQESEHELPGFTPQQLVQSGNNLIRTALEQQLHYAEEQAARIASLRKRLAHMPTIPPSTPNASLGG